MTTPLTLSMEIYQEPGDRTSIQLDPGQGEELRSLIVRASEQHFTRYIEMIGMQPTNVANYLSGRNRISLGVLSKLLAGTDLKLQCTLQILIQNGNTVEDVDSIPLDDLLFSPELDIVVTECTATQTPLLPLTQTSCSSETLLENKMIIPPSPLMDQMVESSTCTSTTPIPTFDTTLLTSLDVDQPPKTTEET